MYYLILVISGELFDVRPTAKELKITVPSRIHYVHSSISAGKESRYHIDVVTEKYFPKLLTLIDEEVEKTVRLLRRRESDVRNSINKITDSVRRVRSPKILRDRLGYNQYL